MIEMNDKNKNNKINTLEETLNIDIQLWDVGCGDNANAGRTAELKLLIGSIIITYVTIPANKACKILAYM